MQHLTCLWYICWLTSPQLLFCCDEAPWARRLIEESAMCGSWSNRWALTYQIVTQSRVSELELGEALYSQSCPHDVPSPKGAPSKPPKECHQLGTKSLHAWCCKGHFLFKLLQTHFPTRIHTPPSNSIIHEVYGLLAQLPHLKAQAFPDPSSSVSCHSFYFRIGFPVVMRGLSEQPGSRGKWAAVMLNPSRQSDEF